MAQFVTCSLLAQGITYEVLNCPSGNGQNVLDLSLARQVPRYEPEDDADVLLRASALLKANGVED